MFQMKGIGNQAPGDGGGGDVPRGFKEQEGDLCGGWGKMSERRNVGNEEWVRQSRQNLESHCKSFGFKYG